MSHSTFHNGITFNMSWRNVTALYKAGHPARIDPEHPGNEKEKRLERLDDAGYCAITTPIRENYFKKKKKIM